MQTSGDWMPGKRADILEMARKWLAVLKVKAPIWDIPEGEVDALENLIRGAVIAQTVFVDTPTPGNRARVAEAYAALKAHMRRLHKTRFFSPPLIHSDWTDLDLRTPDETPTTIFAPTVGATGIIAYPGINRIEVRDMRPDEDVAADTRAKWGFRIHYGILDTVESIGSEAPGRFRIYRVPATPDELPHSVFTRRRRHLFEFMGDSGKRVFIAIRYENSKGNPGPFGPMMEAVIP